MLLLSLLLNTWKALSYGGGKDHISTLTDSYEAEESGMRVSSASKISVSYLYPQDTCGGFKERMLDL